MRQKLYITTTLLIAILLVVNLISNEFHIRFDLTDDRQYTLSQATKDILKNLEEPVTIKAYFSKDLPPNVIQTRTEFQELLIEYSNLANGLVQFEFINPNEKESAEKEATQNGIQPVLINVREKDQVKQQKAFLGATVALGEKQETIPFFQPGSAMEYALTTAIKKLTVVEKTKIGFLQGHGEPSLNELGQLNEQLSILYQPEEVRLSDSTDISPAIKTIIIIRPLDSIPASHFQKLDAFLARGGRLAAAINRVHGDLRNSYGTAISTGLETWLARLGVTVNDNFVVDAKCGSVTLQQQTGFGTIQQQISFPYLPVVGKFSDHPVGKGLENVLFEFASTITFSGDSSKHFTPIAFSSDRSNALRVPQYFDIQKQWTEADLPLKNLVMACALEGNLKGSQSRLIVITDGDFVVNGAGQQPRRLQPDNINLLANSIDWLSDDTGLISLRTKGVTSRPLDQIEDSTKMILKYTNFLLPILFVIGYGLIRMQRNNILRFKRMSENYEEA